MTSIMIAFGLFCVVVTAVTVNNIMQHCPLSAFLQVVSFAFLNVHAFLNVSAECERVISGFTSSGHNVNSMLVQSSSNTNSNTTRPGIVLSRLKLVVHMSNVSHVQAPSVQHVSNVSLPLSLSLPLPSVYLSLFPAVYPSLSFSPALRVCGQVCRKSRTKFLRRIRGRRI